MRKSAAIILNGEPLKRERLISALKKADLIVAADGGANYCFQMQIDPDYVIGDLDSISEESLQSFPKSKIIRIGEQDSTDLEKAWTLIDDLGIKRVIILNGCGRRNDHTLANLLLLSQKSKNFEVEMIDNFGSFRFLQPGKYQFSLPIGQTVSFNSWSPIQGLTLEGFEYPLSEANFSPNFVGISNVVRKTPCTVQFESGLLVMYEVDDLG